MRIVHSLLAVLVLVTSGCTHTVARSPVRSVASYDELPGFVGQPVTVRGEFSLRGKLGPYVLGSGRPVYLVSKGSLTLGQVEYPCSSRLTRRCGCVAGYPHFSHSDCLSACADSSARPAYWFALPPLRPITHPALSLPDRRQYRRVPTLSREFI